jgi:hypothetical protein
MQLRSALKRTTCFTVISNVRSNPNELKSLSDDELIANLRCNYSLYNGKVKERRNPCAHLIKHCTMKAYMGEWVYNFTILDLGTSWRLVVSFTP